MDRYNILCDLISKYDYKSYLEIGIDDGQVFCKIPIQNKIGVDPNPKRKEDGILMMTSDQFFEKNKLKFDLIFIDGLHMYVQTYKDIINSLCVLNKCGTIVCHDINPGNRISQLVPRQCKKWNGDCWKAWVKLRTQHDDLRMYVVNKDHGCGIIQFGKQTLLSKSILSNIWVDSDCYDLLDLHRSEWLNLSEWLHD